MCLTQDIGTYYYLSMQLRAARQRAGMSQTELADKARVDQTLISKIERRSVRGIYCAHVVVVRICAALGLEPEDICEFRVKP